MLYHPDPDAFIATSSDYGALGKTLVSLSDLEFTHDEFVFKMHEKYNKLSVSISKTFPRHFKTKTNFLIYSVSNIPKLRQVPIFPNGELNLLWLQYQIDEIYYIRSIIAHGSVFFSESTPDRISWTFERFINDKKNTWSRDAVIISNGYLASVHYTAWALKHYLSRLIMCLEETSNWEQEYQADKDIRKNRILFSELDDLGIIFDDSEGANKFPPLGPIE